MVLADEPTGNLDAETESDVLDVLTTGAAAAAAPCCWSPTAPVWPPGRPGAAHGGRAVRRGPGARRTPEGHPMKPLHHGLLNARRFARRSFASGLALALCGMLSLAAATVVRGAERSAEATLSTGTGLRQIDLEARTDESTAKRLTPAALTAVAGLPGVRSVEPVVQASFDSGPDESLPPFLLHATSARASVPPPLLERARAEVFP
ncbi:hypothetical protein ACFQ60_26135 [Streptomyces zhihengii]